MGKGKGKGRGRKKKFFFEKKNQKTFALPLISAAAPIAGTRGDIGVARFARRNLSCKNAAP